VKLFPLLADWNVAINVAITPRKVNNGRLLVKRAAKEGVELRFWPLLDREQGYWVNGWNLPAQVKWINRLLVRFPRIQSYILDLEPPINFKGPRGLILGYKFRKLKSVDDTREQLESLVDLLHTQGKIVEATSLPFGTKVVNSLGLPRPRNADLYSYMIYTSFISGIGNMRLVPEVHLNNVLVFCIKKFLAIHGPEKLAVDLGLSSYGIYRRSWMRLHSLDRIKKEVSIVLGLGVKNIRIFALDDNILEISRWLEELSVVEPMKWSLMNLIEDPGIILRVFRKFLL